MQIRRLVKTTLIIITVLIILSAAIIFGLADRVPEDYRIAITRVTLLSEINKPEEDPRRDFAALLSDFSKEVGKGEPVWFVITADEVNLSLASMDEIASYYPTSCPIRPSPILQRAGFTGPVVAMDDGVLTLMAWSTKYDKVISVDINFVFEGAGSVRMQIIALRIGLMPVPKFFLKKVIVHFRHQIHQMLKRFDETQNHYESDLREIIRLLQLLAKMLDGKPVRTEITWKLGIANHIMVDAVEITDGVMKLHFSPMKR